MRRKLKLGATITAIGISMSMAGPVHAGGANTTPGPYSNGICTTAPALNGNGNGKAVGKPGAGCVGKADQKNPPGQLNDPTTDGNNGYECDTNNGVGKSNPAHTACILLV